MQKTRTKYLFVSDDIAMQRLAAGAAAQPSIGGVVGANLEMLRMPCFETLYGGSEENFEPLPPMMPPDPSDPALILHSSGTCLLQTFAIDVVVA